MKKVLVIGAHFDDAELGAGGSMAKWVREGKDVYKLTLTDNFTDFKQRGIFVDYSSSKKESAKACKIMGVREVTNLTIAPCTELAFNKKQMQEIEEFILRNKIDTVVIHNTEDIQQDHVGASAISYVAGRYCSNILMYQSNRYILPKSYYPRVFVDITSTIGIKKKSLGVYSGAHNRYKRLFETTIEWNKVMGYSVFMTSEEKYVEAFVPIKLTL